MAIIKQTGGDKTNMKNHRIGAQITGTLPGLYFFLGSNSGVLAVVSSR
jgi:hypothetical protein